MKHLAIFLLLLVPVLASCSGDKDGQGGRQAAPVHVMTVQPQDVPRVLGAVGNVKASASVGLTPRVTGEIEKVHFTEGQDVKEGDVLLTIDTRPFEATLREKKGQLAKSEAQLHKATNDAGRYGKLVGNGYVSREAYEQTATEAAALRATVQADKAAVESAALDLSYCTLRAPISGRVGGLKVDKGNMVRSSDTTPIVSIDTLSERFFWAIIMRIAQEKVKLKTVPRDLQDIDVSLADIYYGNFSVFQSLPDSWAIDQLFPVMPVHRLNEFPSRQGIISDITCDSDGRIDHFIDPQGLKTTLDLHPLKDGEEYYLGVFLVGAYQETLGDLHNLMGDTNVVSIRVDPDGGYEYVREIRGDSVADILSYVEYDPRRILDDLRATAERAVRAGRLTPSDRFAVLQAFEDGLRGYTYFER